MNEETRKLIASLRPIDDIFFEVLAKDKGVCQEILQTILEDDDLEVMEVIVQDSIKNIYGRSVRLDALCRLGDGSICNIEVQRGKNENHVKRVRYHASCITASESKVGTSFEEVPTVYIVYITEFDVFHAGKTIYHMENIIQETGQRVDDGVYQIFVNTSIHDGTKISELMECFVSKKPQNEKFPRLTKRATYLKNDEEGELEMNSVLDNFVEKQTRKSRMEGKMEGRMEGKMEGISRMIQNFFDSGASEEEVMEKLKVSKKDIEMAKRMLSTK